MSLQTAHDISLRVTVPSDPANLASVPVVSAERRITPAWNISLLKAKLEPVTGIPSRCQTLKVQTLDGSWQTLQPDDSLVSSFGLSKNSEIMILDSRPAPARQNFNDTSTVDKYVMPEEQYEQLEDSVLAWKRRQGLGRFDPNAKGLEQLIEERRQQDGQQTKERGIKVGMRCRVGESDERRGVIRYVGEIEGLGGEREAGFTWVGIEFDEPVGKNDGSVEVDVQGEGGKKGRERKRIFEARGERYGTFSRPEKVEVGDQFGILDDLLGDDMEEI